MYVCMPPATAEHLADPAYKLGTLYATPVDPRGITERIRR